LGYIPAATTENDIHFIQQERVMRKGLQVLKKLINDEEGAALIEYTVLLGILLVAVIATIVLVGAWVNTKWTALQKNLS
jgi:pilus assembly protein Flp/PilA